MRFLLAAFDSKYRRTRGIYLQILIFALVMVGKRIMAIGAITTLLAACNAGKKASSAPSAKSEERITFGRGGGVTGAVEEKIFSSTGGYVSIRRFGTGKADTLARRTLDPKIVAPIFDEYREKVATLVHDQTGNAYKYIRYEKSGKSKQITWVDPGPEAAKTLFEKAQKLVK